MNQFTLTLNAWQNSVVRVLVLALLLFATGCSNTLRTDYGDFEPVGLFTLQERVECVNYKVNTGVFIGTGVIFMMKEPIYALGAGAWMAAFALWEARSVDEQCFAAKGVILKTTETETPTIDMFEEIPMEEPVIVEEPAEEETYFAPYEEYVYDD